MKLEYRIVCAVFLFCVLAPAPRLVGQAKDDPPAPCKHGFLIYLPRFDGKKIDGKWDPSADEVNKVLQDLPCVPNKVARYGDIGEGKRHIQFAFLPSPKSDLGAIAKALAK